jgi:predicted  nucleic acid-binding Zn-ribbon protein
MVIEFPFNNKRGRIMASSQTLKDTVKRAQKEVKKLLTEVQTGKSDRSSLEHGLEELENNINVLDFHINKYDEETKPPRPK